MSFFYLKALHIVFVTTWFAGLFYIVRLFIYHTEAQEKEDTERRILSEQFKIMQRRLWFGITWPSAIITLILGPSLIHAFLPLKDHAWLITKLFFVGGLFLYHLSCHHIYKKLKNNDFKYSPTKLRLWNEVATIFLVAIIFLVVLKDIVHMGYGLIGLVIFTMILMFAIRVYKSIRLKNN